MYNFTDFLVHKLKYSSAKKSIVLSFLDMKCSIQLTKATDALKRNKCLKLPSYTSDKIKNPIDLSHCNCNDE